MRVRASRRLRVGRGDEVVVRARLPAGQQVGRLFVFASEYGSHFSPYVPHVADVVLNSDGTPQMRTPMTMRLTLTHPARVLSFTSDIDGYICVMQEIDRKYDPCSLIKLNRTICPQLPWRQRLHRKLIGMLPWSNHNQVLNLLSSR
jgi:hypothetical protein